MKLGKVINQLKELNFIYDNTKIMISVTKNRSLDIEDILFKCNIPAGEAKKYFGELYITYNESKSVGEYKFPIFYFVLHEEADDKDMQN